MITRGVKRRALALDGDALRWGAKRKRRRVISEIEVCPSKPYKESMDCKDEESCKEPAVPDLKEEQEDVKEVNWPTETDIDSGQLNIPLLKHQRLSLAWMLKQEALQGGGILADDQGLGKTISTLALLIKGGTRLPIPVVWDRKKHKFNGGTLVVCPLCVLRQWEREIQSKMTEGHRFTTLIYHGNSRRERINAKKLASYDVVITTYGTVTMEVPFWRREITTEEVGPVDFNGFHLKKLKKLKKQLRKQRVRRGPLTRVAWHRVVLDEAQHIKNSYTRASLSCHDLISTYRWGLSGTPLQNRIEELFSFYRFLRISPLNSCKFFKEKSNWNVQDAVNNIMLRRTKSTVIDGQPILDLPEKVVTQVRVRFSTEELEFYNELETRFKNKFKEYKNEGTLEMHRSNILVMLLRLRQACDHPRLTLGKINKSDLELEEDSDTDCEDEDEDYVCESEKQESSNDTDEPSDEDEDVTTDDTDEEEEEDDDEDLDDVDEKNPGESPVEAEETELEFLHKRAAEITSSKINTAIDIIKMVPDGEKMLVFSQWTSMLDLLQPELDKACICYKRLDGEMSLTQRDIAIEKFTNDEECKVMLMSLQATSLGLNLVVASHVLMVDVWWNPTVEDQAIDRTHRIGQTRRVHVTRLTVDESVEDKILRIQEKKRAMVDSAFGETNCKRSVRSLSTKELCFIFSSSR